MRSIGICKTEKLASDFIHYLQSKNIESLFENESGEFEVWVYDDNDVEKACLYFQKYLDNPSAKQFKVSLKPKVNLKVPLKEKVKLKASSIVFPKGNPKQTKSSKRGYKYVDVQNNIFSPSGLGIIVITLVTISCFIAYITNLGKASESNWLLFIPQAIFSGQIWRLISPCFLHFGLLHLLFNMLWLLDLGTYLEKKLSMKAFVLLLIAVAIVPNFLQYLLINPLFGGMSGVVFGLFGYIWIQAQVDGVQSDMYIDFLKSAMLFLSLFLSFLGIFGNAANVAHVAGLLTGFVLGYVRTDHFKRNYSFVLNKFSKKD